MTRVNLVPVEELVDKHLVAEKHEITRVLALARNHNPRTVKIPPTYRSRYLLLQQNRVYYK